jgi:PAS domain-containing protein
VAAVVAAETSPVALVLTSLSGEILYANPAFQSLFNAPDLAAQPAVSLQEIAAPYLEAALLRDLARSGQPRQFELRVPPGSEVRWRCHARRERGEAGMPKWLVLAFTELGGSSASSTLPPPIEDARNRIERLERSGSWSLRMHGSQQVPFGHMCWSQGLSDLLGQEHSDQPRSARDWIDAIHRDDRVAVTEALRALIAEGRDYSIEYRLGDGARTLRSRGQLATHLPGGAITIIGIERDVTDTVSVPRALLCEHYLQRALADCQESPAFSLDHHYRLRWFNALFGALMRELWGAEPEPDWTLEQIVRQPSQRRRAIHSIRQSLLGKRAAAEWLVMTHGFGARCYDLTYNPVWDDGGKILGVVAIAADVSAKRLLDHRGGRRNRRVAASTAAAG